MATKIDDLVTLLIKEFSETKAERTQEQKEVLGYLLGFKYCSKSGISKLIEKIQSLENLNLPAFLAIHNLNESLLNDDNISQNIFTWIESEMVACIKAGRWVYIKGVESVNPAILERLNAIMEKGELVFLNEALGGTEDNKELKKNPNFKIFLKFDESKAKTQPSRALRNRCIEFRMRNFMP